MGTVTGLQQAQFRYHFDEEREAQEAGGAGLCILVPFHH